MPGVTQPTEYPGKYQEKVDAMVAIAKERRRGKLTEKDEAEYRIVCKQAMILEAEDKIEFSLRGEIRRGKHKKMGIEQSEFETLWRKKMKYRLIKDGYPFKLEKEEQAVIDRIREEANQKKIAEMTNMASETLKKMITTA